VFAWYVSLRAKRTDGGQMLSFAFAAGADIPSSQNI